MKFKLEWTDATMGRPSEIFEGLRWKVENPKDLQGWTDYYVWTYFEANSIEEAKEYVKANRYNLANGRDGVEIFECMVKIGRSWEHAFTEEDFEGKNTCDRCGKLETSEDLIWVSSEDFVPKKGERPPLDIALKYDALCEKCYKSLLK